MSKFQKTVIVALMRPRITTLQHILLILMALSITTFAFSASFDCSNASTEIEKCICDDYELSRLDHKLGVFYQRALDKVPEPAKLRQDQREWLKQRNRCEDATCLKKHYNRRIEELMVLASGHKLYEPPPPMTKEEIQRVYVTERKKKIQKALADRSLKIVLGEDKPICRQFMRDFTAQNDKIKLIPPAVVTYDYESHLLEKHIFGACPDLELRSHKIGMSGPAVGPRRFILYRADIDSNPNNGDEVLFIEEAMWIRERDYGREIAVKNTIHVLDLPNCTTKGHTWIGASRRLPVTADVSQENPQTALYGVTQHLGKHYIYNVISNEPKAPPLTLAKYQPNGFGEFSMVCNYINAKNH